MDFQTKSHAKDVLHMSLAVFVKNGIFAYLTLKLSFWPWRWPWIIKIIQEMDCPVKITWKWGITLVPGFICWKIISALDISGGHFVFALQKFRPRVPKWHPADSCSGHPLEPDSAKTPSIPRNTLELKNVIWQLDYNNNEWFWLHWCDAAFISSHAKQYNMCMQHLMTICLLLTNSIIIILYFLHFTSCSP